MKPREEIRALLRRILNSRGDTEPFDDEEMLFASGRFDSLAIFEVISHLEQNYKVDFSSLSFDPMHLSSVNRILELF